MMLKIIPEGPEMEEFKESRKEFEREFPNVLGTVTGGTSIDPITVDLANRKVEELLQETTGVLESKLVIQLCGYEQSVRSITNLALQTEVRLSIIEE